jgi:hypothetical protein
MNILFIVYSIHHKATDQIAIERLVISVGEPLSREGDFWIILTEKSSHEVRDLILPHLDSFDCLLVGTVGDTICHGTWGSKDIRNLSRYFTLE